MTDALENIGDIVYLGEPQKNNELVKEVFHETK